MSTSRAIKPKRDDTLLSNWESTPERAPSIMREDQPTVARVLAMIGLFLLVLGTLAMLAPGWQRATVLNPGFGFFIATIGVAFILFHAFSERDFQFRRLYGFAGMGLIAFGVILRVIAFRSTRAMTWPVALSGPEVFFFFAVPALFLGLILLIAVIRNETDAYFRNVMVNLVGGLGALMIAYSVIMGLRDTAHQFLPGEGAALMILGLLYASSYIGLQETGSERAYRAGLALGAVGLIGIVGGLIRSLPTDSLYLVPSGLILMGLSLVYLFIAVGICVDWPIVTMTRRELSTYFFSPVAYLVFVGQLICGWFMFLFFYVRAQSGMFEPIIHAYIMSIFPIFVQSVLVPALTMRLLSEEKRTGTLEVLLTAPVNEITVVLSKFLACWFFNLLLWVPWWLFLVSLRYMGQEEFDYRPILSFTVALAATSAGFMAMGLFFSSLTNNQIIAAVFTFVGMLAHLACYWGGNFWDVLSYINYFDFWDEALQGTLAPRLVVFHLSVAVVFLFATVKVLESRKWK